MLIANKNSTIIPTIDYVFKKIFGNIGNEEITKGLIGSIIGKNIKSITLQGNPILEKDFSNEKLGILDIKAVLDFDILCDIEMQVLNNKNIEKRILYYWSKLYSKSINSGSDYSKLKKTICILIANFKLNSLEKIHKFHTEWRIRENECSKVVLTDVLEIHILELPKIENILKQNNIPEKDKKLIIWSKFLLNPDELGENEMEENKDVKMAKEELEKMRNNEYEAELAELRQKAIMDERNIEAFGYDNGVKDNKIKVVKKLLKRNFSIDEIIEITELTKEEIEKLL